MADLGSCPMLPSHALGFLTYVPRLSAPLQTSIYLRVLKTEWDLHVGTSFVLEEQGRRTL